MSQLAGPGAVDMDAVTEREAECEAELEPGSGSGLLKAGLADVVVPAAAGFGEDPFLPRRERKRPNSAK